MTYFRLKKRDPRCRLGKGKGGSSKGAKNRFPTRVKELALPHAAAALKTLDKLRRSANLRT